jgi:hypothetical protein
MSKSGITMPVIPVFGKLKQKNHEFEASLGYMVRPSLKKPMTGDVAQWYSTYLEGMHKVLGSITSTAK